MPLRISTQDLVVLVNQEKLPMADVMTRTGLTRQAIWKRLRNAGELEKRCAKGGAPSKVIVRPCAFCGEPIARYRKRVARTKQMRAFCKWECYAASLEQHPFEEWRQGSRLARAIVAQHFPLQDQHVVHHKDGNQRHNDLANLMVFKDQADHMAHHRGRLVKTLFDGAMVKM